MPIMNPREFDDYSRKTRRQTLRELEKSDYKDKAKELRRWRKDYKKYDLRKNLHLNTKRKIERDFQELKTLLQRPNIEIKSPRSRKTREAYQNLAHLPATKYKHFPISKPTPNADIRLTKDRKTGQHEAYFSTKGTTERALKWDKEEFVKDPEGTFYRTLYGVNPDRHDRFRIITGNHYYGGDLSPAEMDLETVAQRLQELWNKYRGIEGHDPKEWLDGVYWVKMK